MAGIVGDLFSQLGQTLLSPTGFVSLVIGVLVPVGANVYLREVEKRRQRKRLLYNVLLNSKLGVPDAGDVVTFTDRNGDAIADPSLAVVRITNDSAQDIGADDYRIDTRIEFPESVKVRTVDVTETHPDTLAEQVKPITITGNTVTLPKVHLNAKERFKLLILHTGGSGVIADVRVKGSIKGGNLEDARHPKQAARRRWRVATMVVASLSLGALLAAALLYYTGFRPSNCSKGTLAVGGSSAFANAASRVAGAYASYCTQASVQVVPSNSQQGLAELADHLAKGDGQQRVALTDGDAGQAVPPGVTGQAVAIVPYTIVVNPGVFPPGTKSPVNLTTAQIRLIFDGRQKNWNQINTSFAPIPVRVVGRVQSGSRTAFELYVLGSDGRRGSQGKVTSSNCADRDYVTSGDTLLCEVGSTATVIDQVGKLAGAIGYADAPDAARAGTSLLTVAIDGRGAELSDIVNGYQFWTVEHAYHRAKGDQLATDFVDYLTGDDQESALQSGGYPPCGANQLLCSGR